MPWKESCTMEERLKFIVEARGGVTGITELARAYGVSRKTAYKWLGRYEEAGAPGLLERSRAPHSKPWAVPEEVAALIVALRKRRPTWGPRKLLAALEGEQLGIKLPAASTVAELLSRRGLVVHRRRARRRRAARLRALRKHAGSAAPPARGLRRRAALVRRMLAEAQADVMNRWRLYEQMAAMPGAEAKTTEGGK